jgi:hypothetical protein
MHSRQGPTHSTPRWVKLFGIAALVLGLLVLVVIFTGIGGPHGPGRHWQGADVGNEAANGGQSR